MLAAVVCLALAVAVLLRGRATPSLTRFAALALNLVAWFVADALVLTELTAGVTGLALQGFVLAAFPATLIGFFATFTDGEDRFARASELTGRLLTGLMAATGLILLATGGLFPDPHAHHDALVGLIRFSFMGILLTLGLALVLMVRRTRALELHSERMRVVALTAVSGVVFSLALLAYALDLGVAWLGNMTPALFMFFVYQVITLRRILDVYEFVGRVLVLGGFALVLTAIYAVLVAWWRYDLGLFLFNTAIATVVILILLDPLRSAVELRLNELVFRERFEFTRQADGIRRALANVIDIGALSDLLMSRLGTSRQVTHASLWLRDTEGLVMKRLGFVGTAPPATLDAIRARPLLTRLLQHKVLTIEGLEAERDALIVERERASGAPLPVGRVAGEESVATSVAVPTTRTVTRPVIEEVADAQVGIEVLETMIAMMRELQAQLMVALTGSPRQAPLGGGLELDAPTVEVLGFLAVKNERLREAWSADETRALVAVAAQATIIVENSRLFDRIRERDRLAAVGQMAAGLAHEIRNPLGAIKGAAELLAEVDASERATFLQIISEEVNRLDAVVSQFLTYARPLKGKRDKVNVNEVLERTLTLIAAYPHGSKVELIQAPGLPEIPSDPELIRQVTLNLARNATEAMAPQGGGRLTITTAVTWRSGAERSRETRASGVMTPGSYIRIRFDDEGPGIPAEVMERLFIPFYTTKQTGTGLGLAICQRIVESLGGTIEVSSRGGQGATFAVFLPVVEAPVRATAL